MTSRIALRPLGPYAPLLAWAALLSALNVAYVAAGGAASGEVGLLAELAFSLAAVCWVVVDARRGGRIPCFDFAFLVAVFFPLSVVWNAFWSRGWRGLGSLAAMAGVLLFPVLVALIAWGVAYIL